MCCTIRKMRMTGEVVLRFLAVSHNVERVFQADPVPRSTHEEGIRLVVFSVEHGSRIHRVRNL